jgi:uncharacterized membrane protein YgaE (UPF0421/DUF939 family)
VALPTAVRDAVDRVRGGAWAAGQCGLAAFVAWELSTRVLGHPAPYFAAVAAVVSLGLRTDARIRRTGELALGVSAGILVGDLLVSVLGQGAWQIGVVVFAALIIAVAVGGTGLAITQAGLQAVFVVALPRTPHSALHRWEDALVGGAIALLVAAVLPAQPWKHAERLQEEYLHELAHVLRDTAAGTRNAATADAAEALARGRALDLVLASWKGALVAGRETSRISPLRRDRGDFWPRSALLHNGVTKATRNLRVMIRRVMVALEMTQPLPLGLADLLEALADAVESADPIPLLLDVAARLDPVPLEASTLSAQVVVGQLRVAVLDLLEGFGLDHDLARQALPRLSA